MSAGSAGQKVRVLIVDDSALVRKLLTRMLASDPGIEVVGAAADAFAAREQIKKYSPDVLTLDVEMPKMNGLQFLRNLMRLRPMPVVMCSSLTARGAEVTLAALELGAVDFIAKPQTDVLHTLEDYTAELVEKVKMAASARVRPLGAVLRSRVEEQLGVVDATPVAAAPVVRRKARPVRGAARFVAIGASTGGTEAIRELLCRLPGDSPGIVICQHIPKTFSGAFARRMDDCSQLAVREAQDGDVVTAGHAFIAPGDQHLVVEADGARLRCRLLDDPPYRHHRPSVDVLFQSVARAVGAGAVGVLLTGMGSDGAQGLRDMLDAGALTIAQDQASSVVWGMPGSAVALGAASQVLPLNEIADAIVNALACDAEHSLAAE